MSKYTDFVPGWARNMTKEELDAMPDCPPTGMIPPDDESEAIQRHVEGFMVFHELAMAEPEVWGNAMPTLAHSLADRLTSAGQPVPEELRRWVEGEK